MEFFRILFSVGLLPEYIASREMDPSGASYIILMTIAIIGCSFVPYLLGSFNFSIMISKRQYNEDIRNYGSGNAGMTNMMRTYGKKAAALTLIGDALKAIVACLLGYVFLGQNGAYFAGLFCIIGHMFPIFFKFRGGKGVVTAAATVLMCNPFVFLIVFVLFVAIVFISKYISLGSVMCVLVYPLILNRMDKLIFKVDAMPYHAVAVFIAVLVVIKHWENIKRLMNGTENKFSFKKSVKSNNRSKDVK